MASLAGSAIGITAIPGVGWVAGIAFAYVDSRFILPELFPSRARLANPQKLLDVPTGAQGQGSPAIWAIGRRVRVPVHVMWQSRKTRETNSSAKSGSGIVQRQVFVDALLALNTRKSSRLSQLFGNGRLLAWNDRNLIGVTTSGMTASWISGTTATLTMADTSEVSFANTFRVGDLVNLSGFNPVSSPGTIGPVLMGTVWRVSAVTAHGFPTTSQLTLAGVNLQGFVGVSSATGGTPDSPASVTRLDDTFDIYEDMLAWTASGSFIHGAAPTFTAYDSWISRLNSGDRVTFFGGGTYGNYDGRVYEVQFIGAQSTGWGIDLKDVANTGSVPPVTGGPSQPRGSSSDRLFMRVSAAQKTAPGFFPASFDLNAQFLDGDESQGEHPLMVAAYGTGEVSAYRGVCVQGLDSFNVTQIGGQLPYSMDVVMECDPSMSLRSAVKELLVQGGLSVAEVDTTGVRDRSFEGMYTRGPVPMKQAIQPVLAAYRLLAQERDGKVCVLSIENADIVYLQNTQTGYSDLGWKAQKTQKTEKLLIEHAPQEKLPTSVGVYFQDPDLGYSEGFEPFTLRSPSGTGYENVAGLSLVSLALRRRDARDLATNTLRLAWINSTTFATTLSSRFLHLLENDVLSVPDDNGVIHTGRVIQRNEEANWLVSVICTVEELSLSITNSPVTSSTTLVVPTFPPLPVLAPVVLDMPAVSAGGLTAPALVLAVCATAGGHWAGVTVFESQDDETWIPGHQFTIQSIIGELVDPLLIATPSEAYGTTTLTQDTQSFDVQFYHDGDGIVSSTLADNADGANWFAIIDGSSGEIEIIAVETVTPGGSGLYSFTDMLRGLRGTATESGIEHPIGSKIVMLTDETLKTRTYPGVIAPTTRFFRFVPAGGSIDSVSSIEVDATWRNIRPFPLRKLTKTIGASPYPVTLTAEHWTRTIITAGAVGPYPMDDPPETYKFRLYNVGGGFIEYERTVTANGSGSSTLRDAEATFTAAELTAAGYAPGASLSVVVDCVQVNQYGDGPSVLQVL